MGFRCGIVGLPNVGKSTLFNALTETQAAQAANYPFCTIEPNIGNVAVPDDRLEKLAAIASSKKIIATQLAFVDIAGLVAMSEALYVHEAVDPPKDKPAPSTPPRAAVIEAEANARTSEANLVDVAF